MRRDRAAPAFIPRDALIVPHWLLVRLVVVVPHLAHLDLRRRPAAGGAYVHQLLLRKPTDVPVAEQDVGAADGVGGAGGEGLLAAAVNPAGPLEGVEGVDVVVPRAVAGVVGNGDHVRCLPDLAGAHLLEAGSGVF